MSQLFDTTSDRPLCSRARGSCPPSPSPPWWTSWRGSSSPSWTRRKRCCNKMRTVQCQDNGRGHVVDIMPMVIVIQNSIGGKPCVLLFGNVHIRLKFSLAAQNFGNISKLYLYIISSSFWKCKSFVCLPLDIQIMQNVLNILWKTIIGGENPFQLKYLVVT